LEQRKGRQESAQTSRGQGRDGGGGGEGPKRVSSQRLGEKGTIDGSRASNEGETEIRACCAAEACSRLNELCRCQKMLPGKKVASAFDRGKFVGPKE